MILFFCFSPSHKFPLENSTCHKGEEKEESANCRTSRPEFISINHHMRTNRRWPQKSMNGRSFRAALRTENSSRRERGEKINQLWPTLISVTRSRNIYRHFGAFTQRMIGFANAQSGSLTFSSLFGEGIHACGLPMWGDWPPRSGKREASDRRFKRARGVRMERERAFSDGELPSTASQTLRTQRAIELNSGLMMC